ncbi:dipeptidyl aminopeptidase/acylaminoacyl peptidase [Bacillus mesophilus]|uniref:S9 family peptidase n=1 Tax=Bacillus mesophilus TaxID=1808955 RepID=A0A6M0QAQ3_9BACI|nr:S9 family peptidase [Bacillus mesophilus]MBM7662003.1 dipeptidyl aminopeptidase/acylaminoacyl peptidase [Bacillus mesophilus]NEY72640.1 S9 family peptidase [Bacillus mesophilus]
MINFKKPDVENFFKTYAIQNFAVSPDEKQLILSTNLSGKYNLWAMDLPNQFPYPLTFINQSNQELTYDHEGRFIVAGFDQDGDENTQLYALQTHGGELKELRVEVGQRHMNPILSKDGKTLYYTSTKGNPTYLNTYSYNFETDSEEMINEGEKAATFLVDVSPNERLFVYQRLFANTYTLAYVEIDGKEVLLTPPTEQQHTVSSVVFTSDTEIYLLTNFEDDNSYLAKFDTKNNEFTKVLAVDQEDLSSLKFNKKLNKLFITSSKGVEDVLYQYDLTDGKLTVIDKPVSVIEKLVVTKEGSLYILGRSATSPLNIYKRSDADQEWLACTNLAVPGVAKNELVEPEVISYPSFDGLDIEGLFFKAKEEVSNGHVILWPHGGPQASERKSFRALFQFLVNRGYSLFAPNFRGSSDYGLSFMKMVEGDWGYGPRLDNVEGLEWLIKNGYADRDKILLMGGSFGGYMALLLHGRHPEYFKAVVDIFGPSDLFSFIDSVPEHWKPIMNQWVGDPVKDKEKLIEYSPITYLENMKKPMLVIQGANDPRVVKAESDKIVKALQDKGVNVEYLVLEDEGHGFSKKENEIKVNRTILEFFDRFI